MEESDLLPGIRTEQRPPADTQSCFTAPCQTDTRVRLPRTHLDQVWFPPTPPTLHLILISVFASGAEIRARRGGNPDDLTGFLSAAERMCVKVIPVFMLRSVLMFGKLDQFQQRCLLLFVDENPKLNKEPQSNLVPSRGGRSAGSPRQHSAADKTHKARYTTTSTFHSLGFFYAPRRWRANKRYPMMQCGCQKEARARGGSASSPGRERSQRSCRTRAGYRK